MLGSTPSYHQPDHTEAGIVVPQSKERARLIVAGWARDHTTKRRDELVNPSLPSLFAKLQADLVYSETHNLVFRPGLPAEAITLLLISSLTIGLVSDSH